jgi:rRNA large subunit m3Psi methyltransferase RlmH
VRIRLIAVGQRMPAWISDGYNDYTRRLKPRLPVELVEIPAGRRGSGDVARAMSEEGKAILGALRPQDHVVALDEHGKQRSSVELSRWLAQRMQSGNDLAFLVGNLTKISTGGWVPLAFAAVMFAMFVTWRDGRQKLRSELEARAVPDKKLPELIEKTTRVPGTSVFLVSQSGFVPTALLRNIEHNKVHHEQIVILHIEIQRIPRVDPMSRVLVAELYKGVFDVRARFGFMETPDVGEALRNARRQGMDVFAEDSSFFLGWHLVRARPRPGLAGLKMRAFAFLQRRSAQAAEFFRMPTRGVVVLATDIEI